MALALSLSSGLAQSTFAQDAKAPWRDQVWASVDHGDSGRFQDLMRDASDAKREDLVTLRDATSGLRATLDRREKLRDEELAKVDKLFNEELAAGGTDLAISRSLRQAIELSMISRDKPAFMAESRVQALIQSAQTAARQAESRGDWLSANDIYMNLNALTEESGTYRPDIDRQIARLAMIRLYAPERLWEMRQHRRQAEFDYAIFRAKDDEDKQKLTKAFSQLPAYNPVGDRWAEKLSGISDAMVISAIIHGAKKHVDGTGMNAMLRSGLDAIATMVTTPDLQSAFPGLADEATRTRFLELIDEQRQQLAATGARADYPDLVTLVLKLNDNNQRTVKIAETALYHEFGNGAMRALDEFSAFIWPDEMSRFNKSTQAKFVGVGVHIVMDDTGSMVKVLTPLAGTPAHRAGLRPNDLITAVNGQSAIGFTLDQAVDVITGRAGTPVTLTIERAGEAGAKVEQTFTMTRTEIKLPTVKGWKRVNADEGQWDWFIDPAARIGYVRLTQFAETTNDEFKDAINQMKKAGLNGLILDLRFNPGGLLDQAVEVANEFVPRKSGTPFNGVVVTTHDAKDRQVQVERLQSSNAPLTDLPIVVLVNEGAASASEIVSGAIQDYARAGTLRAVLVGQRTFGKGSVQNVWPLAQDASSAVKITTQYYKLPGGRLIHRKPGAPGWGVEPNFTVEMLPTQIAEAYSLRQNADVFMLGEQAPAGDPNDKTATKPAPNPDDLITKGIDLQLHHALVLLQSQVTSATPALVAATNLPPIVANEEKKN